MNSPCCRATSTVRLLLLLMAARQQNWLLLRWTERYFALWSEILHLFLWRFSASSCRCPIAQDLVVVLSSHSVRSHQADGSLLTAARLLGAAVYLHSQWGRDHLHRCLQPVHSWQWLCHWGEFMRSTKGKFSPFPKRYFLAKVFGGWIGTLGNSCSWCDYNSTKWRNSRLMRYVYM